MEQAILESLKSMIGHENVSSGSHAAKKFTRVGQQAPNMVVASPSCDEEVQRIVNLAREKRTPIITANDRYLLPEDLEKEGVLLDFSRMNRIEQIDTRNLMAHVQRGVTWE
jgi:FAD/FMN-containing dehydrogenase